MSCRLVSYRPSSRLWVGRASVSRLIFRRGVCRWWFFVVSSGVGSSVILSVGDVSFVVMPSVVVSWVVISFIFISSLFILNIS